ncbi:hypothetical protein Bbelb_033640 [Branchiostoma belcheri]|nr:hypothetical protein Bbelb_033640 [Branchiostoma belcheri]
MKGRESEEQPPGILLPFLEQLRWAFDSSGIGFCKTVGIFEIVETQARQPDHLMKNRRSEDHSFAGDHGGFNGKTAFVAYDLASRGESYICMLTPAATSTEIKPQIQSEVESHDSYAGSNLPAFTWAAEAADSWAHFKCVKTWLGGKCCSRARTLEKNTGKAAKGGGRMSYFRPRYDSSRGRALGWSIPHTMTTLPTVHLSLRERLIRHFGQRRETRIIRLQQRQKPNFETVSDGTVWCQLRGFGDCSADQCSPFDRPVSCVLA